MTNADMDAVGAENQVEPEENPLLINQVLGLQHTWRCLSNSRYTRQEILKLKAGNQGFG
jgi:hypothetical protein